MKKKFVTCLLAAICGSAVLSFTVLATEADTGAETEFTTDTTDTSEAESETPDHDDAELSDDLYSFQMKINSDIYTFPMSYDEFLALGWTYKNDETMEIQPNSYSPSERFSLGDLEVYATVTNLGINTVPVTQCAIAGISIDSFQMADVTDVTIELPGGIQYGVSTLDDITAAYGTPSDTYEGDLYTKVTYEKDYYQDVDLYLDSETGLLNEIEIRNMVADDEANDAAAADVSNEPTPEVLAYKAPTALGDDLTSFIVDYAGDLYQLPAPVSEFLNNGWTIDKDKSASVIAGKGYDWIYMSKDNQNYHTIVRNYNANATVVENCFVTDVEGDVNSTNLPVTVQKGLTLGLTEKEVVSALDGETYELDDSSDTFHYYTITGSDSSLDKVEIIVNTEKDAVTSIEVSYTPKTLE